MTPLSPIAESDQIQRDQVKRDVLDMARDREAGTLRAVAYNLIRAADELAPGVEPTDEDRQQAMGMGQMVLDSLANDLPFDIERAVGEYDLENDEFLIDDIRAELRSELKELGEKY